ncbi:MAG TPA: flagellar motor protein [Vicinamibacterales bacterium]|jgi:chemotaxis protein MotA
MAPRNVRKRRLDLTSVMGVPLGIGIILLGQVLEGGSARSLLQLTAAIIVFGGTLGAVLVSFPFADVKRAVASLGRVFTEDDESADSTVSAILRYARIARKDGMLALEEESAHAKDPLLRKGLMLAVDGVNPKTVREMLEIDLAGAEERDLQPSRVYDAAGGYAPTVGILGAVLGLIHVMENLSDPSRLGSGIAVAFVATVYGVGVANLILLPIANKLRVRATEAARRRILVFEGVLAIQEGLNPRLIDQKLRGFTGTPAARAAEPDGRAA